jgi:hypothetical protein
MFYDSFFEIDPILELFTGTYTLAYHHYGRIKFFYNIDTFGQCYTTFGIC